MKEMNIHFHKNVCVVLHPYLYKFDNNLILEKIKALNDNTKIFCAHEYTEQNLCFSQSIEPDNIMAQEHLTKVKQLRLNNQPTIPTTLKLEKQINPFLRCQSLVDFQNLRQKKDAW